MYNITMYYQVYVNVVFGIYTVKLRRRAGANPLGGACAAAPSDSDVLIERLACSIILLWPCPAAAAGAAQCLYYKLRLYASTSPQWGEMTFLTFVTVHYIVCCSARFTKV